MRKTYQNVKKAQAALAARESRKQGTLGFEKAASLMVPEGSSGPATTSMPTGRSVGRRWGKYNARACTDEEGTVFHSMLEREAVGELRALERQGVIKNLKRQSDCAYNFGTVKLPYGKLKRKYLPDATFDCVKAFSMMSIKGPIMFEAGRHYVVDVKSPPTVKNEVYKLKRELMWCLFGVKIIEIIRRPPRKIKGRN
jgi:hypothetical protein